MMTSFNDVFHPEKKLKNKRLTGNSPCIDCPNVHRYHRGTSITEEVIDKDKCDNCIVELNYHMDCMIKLKWYEDNDEKVKDANRKDKYIYDCAVKYPEKMDNESLILYPEGWKDIYKKIEHKNKETEKHGKWIILDKCANEGIYCSNCQKKVYTKNYASQKRKTKYSKYCPNCGVKMDGEEIKYDRNSRR